jgi:DNA-binding response OmpR family regulator
MSAAQFKGAGRDSMSRVVLVEDSTRLAGMIGKALAAAGIQADAFERMGAAWNAVCAGSYAAAIIDRGLPDGDGLNLVRRLRSAGLSIPCLMLTARDALHDRVDGLESGADDYLAKPFPMEELVARVRALMRRPAELQDSAPGFGDLQLQPLAGCANCGIESITLSPAEMEILSALVSAQGRTIRRGALEHAAWGLTEPVTPNALDVALHRLRRKLLAIGSKVKIVNNRGYGFSLIQSSLRA